MLPNASASVKNYDGQTKCMYFSIKDNGLLNKYIIIWDNVSADIKKEFDSKPVQRRKFLKTKTKSYGDEATDFLDKEVAKVDSYSNCLAVISLDSTCNCLALISLDSALKKMETIIRKCL